MLLTTVSKGLNVPGRMTEYERKRNISHVLCYKSSPYKIDVYELENSVNRFGEISPLWQIFDSLFLICQNA